MLSRTVWLTFACAAGCLAVACWRAGSDRGVAAEKPPAPAITVVRDVPYREGPSRRWRLDLAMKKDPHGKPRPAVVVIHGGGWLEGDRSSFASRRHGVPGNKDVSYHRLAYVDHCPHSLVRVPGLRQVVDEFFLRTLMHPETSRQVRRRAAGR